MRPIHLRFFAIDSMISPCWSLSTSQTISHETISDYILSAHQPNPHRRHRGTFLSTIGLICPSSYCSMLTTRVLLRGWNLPNKKVISAFTSGPGPSKSKGSELGWKAFESPQLSCHFE